MANFLRQLFKKDARENASAPESPAGTAAMGGRLGAEELPVGKIPDSPFAVAQTPNPRLHTTFGVATTSELAFTAGELINLVPPQHIRPGHTVAPNAEIPLPLTVLRAALLAGRPAILLSQLHEACPEVFLAPAHDDADEIINLPPQKVQRIVEQASAKPLNGPTAGESPFFPPAAAAVSPFSVDPSALDAGKSKLPPPRRRFESDDDAESPSSPSTPSAPASPLTFGGPAPALPAAASPFSPFSPEPAGASPFSPFAPAPSTPVPPTPSEPPASLPVSSFAPANGLPPQLPPAPPSPFSPFAPVEATGAAASPFEPARVELPPAQEKAVPSPFASPFAQADSLPATPPSLPPVSEVSSASPFAVVPASEVPPGLESPFARQPIQALSEPPESIPVVTAFAPAAPSTAGAAPEPGSPLAPFSPAPVVSTGTVTPALIEPAPLFAAADEIDPAATVEFGLAELLRGVWPADLGFDPKLVPDALRIALPLAPLAAQVPNGRVSLPLSEVIEHVDGKYRAAFSRAVPTAAVPIALSEVLAALEATSPAAPAAPTAAEVATVFSTPFSMLAGTEPAAPPPMPEPPLAVVPPAAVTAPEPVAPTPVPPGGSPFSLGGLPPFDPATLPIIPPSEEPAPAFALAPVESPLPSVPALPVVPPPPEPLPVLPPVSVAAPAAPAVSSLPFSFGAPVEESTLVSATQASVPKEFPALVESKQPEPPREAAAPPSFARLKPTAPAPPQALGEPLPFSFGAAPPAALPPLPAAPAAATPPPKNPFTESPGALFGALPSFELPVSADDDEPVALESLKTPVGGPVILPEPVAAAPESTEIALSPELPPLPFSFAPFGAPAPVAEPDPTSELPEVEEESPAAALPSVEAPPSAPVTAKFELPPVLPPMEPAPPAAVQAPEPFSFASFAAPEPVTEIPAAPVAEKLPVVPPSEPVREPAAVAAPESAAPESAAPESAAADSPLPFSFASFIAPEPTAPAAVATPVSERTPEPAAAPEPVDEASAPATALEDLSFAINDDPTQLALRAIFSTDKTLRPQDVVDFSSAFPGLRSCLIMTPDAVVHSGRDADAEDVRHFREKAGALYTKTISLVRELDPDAAEQTFSLRTAKGLLSFFAHGDTCLAVLHETPAFQPGVREKLTLVARSLSSILES